jgi:hypothetical protein
MNRLFDDAWNKLHARDNTLEVLRSYLRNVIPSRLTFAHCLDRQTWDQIYVPDDNTQA